MKKSLISLSILAIMGLFCFVISCTHQPPLSGGNSCVHLNYSVTADTTNNGHNDGSIIAHATGGTGFVFSLNGSALQSDSVFGGLAGNASYTLLVSNAEGCSDSVMISVDTVHGSSVVVNPCASFALTATGTNPTVTGASDGSIACSASGASSPYTYSKDGMNFSSSSTFTGLAEGTYTITAKSGEGCTKTKQVVLTAGTATLISFSRDIQPVIYSTCGQASCHNHSNNYQTYANIVGTPGATWSACTNLNSFVKRVKGTTSLTTSGLHDMPTSGTASWNTFVSTYFIPWINQGFQNN